MRTRLFALFASALLAAGISVSGATPAHAAFGGTCAENSFCLYQWVDFGTQIPDDRWQTSLYNISIHQQRCLNIAPINWNNGTPVNDNSASMVIRVNGATWANHTIEVFNWVNCNPDGGYDYFTATSTDWSYTVSNLNNLLYLRASDIHLYHTITSVAVL